MKRFAVVIWAALVIADGGLTLLLEKSGPVDWDDWGRDEPLAPTSCHSPGAVAKENEAAPWPISSVPQSTAHVLGPTQPVLEPAREVAPVIACAYRIEN
ncbi:hypothetical protein ACWHLZ_45140 [Streptomyces chartreusis]